MNKGKKEEVGEEKGGVKEVDRGESSREGKQRCLGKSLFPTSKPHSASWRHLHASSVPEAGDHICLI